MDVHRQQRVDRDLLSDDANHRRRRARHAGAGGGEQARCRCRQPAGRERPPPSRRNPALCQLRGRRLGCRKAGGAERSDAETAGRVALDRKVATARRYPVESRRLGHLRDRRAGPGHGGRRCAPRAIARRFAGGFRQGGHRGTARRSRRGRDSVRHCRGGQGLLDGEARRRRRQAVVCAGSNRHLFDRRTESRPRRAAEDGRVRTPKPRLATAPRSWHRRTSASRPPSKFPRRRMRPWSR